MTAPALKKLVSKWQRILRLQDWDLVVRFDPSLAKDATAGKCNAMPLRKAATIGLLEPEVWEDKGSEHPGFTGVSREIELSLIHEMLHCHFQFRDLPRPDTFDELILENGMESLALAFYNREYGL